jgi:hypothetical protein
MKPHVRWFAVAAVLVSASLAADSTEASLRIQDLVALVPSDAKFKAGSRWQAIGTAAANEALKTSLNKNAEFVLKVAVLEPHPYNGQSIVIHSKPAPVKINGTSIPSVVYAYFDASGLEGLGRVRVGDTITVSGILKRSEIQADQSRVFFELVQARVQPAKPK